MKPVNIHEAKTHLSRMIERVRQGEQFVIAKAGKPVAMLVPFQGADSPRQGGRWKGLVRIGDDFDAPLPADVDQAFRGERA